MSVGWFPVSNCSLVFDRLRNVQNSAHRRNIEIGSNNKNGGKGQGDVERAGKNLDLSGLVLHVGKNRLPVIIDVQNSSDQEEHANGRMLGSPVAFCQAQELPVGPIGDSSLRHYIEND